MEEEYRNMASELLLYAMGQRNADCEELRQRLRQIGVEIGADELETATTSGCFSAAFLLQCIEALRMRLPAMRR